MVAMLKKDLEAAILINLVVIKDFTESAQFFLLLFLTKLRDILMSVGLSSFAEQIFRSK